MDFSLIGVVGVLIVRRLVRNVEVFLIVLCVIQVILLPMEYAYLILILISVIRLHVLHVHSILVLNVDLRSCC